MPRKKGKGYLLIRSSDGSISTCGRCSSKHVQHVLHLNIGWTDLGVYKDDMSRAERTALMKAYPRMCDEKFLCEKCYRAEYKTNEAYILNTGQYEYTSVLAKDWEDTEWVTLNEAVAKFS